MAPNNAPLQAFGCDTPQRLFRARCQAWGDAPALRHKQKGIWASTSWSGYYAQARAIGLALAGLGLRRGDTIAILSENRPEWLVADMGAQCMGFMSTGIYPTSSPEQVLHILNDAEVRVLFVENQEQYDKAMAVRGQAPSLQRIVVTHLKGLRGLSDPMVSTYADFLAQGQTLAATQAAQFEQAIDASRPEDTAFFIHARIHKMHARARACFHTHMPYATALAITEGEPFDWAVQSQLKFYGRTVIDPIYNGLALDNSEGDRIARAMGNADIVFMANHGVTVVGPDVANAWDDLYYLERAAEAQVKAAQSGRKILRGDPAMVEKTARIMREGEGARPRMHLESVKRRLAASDPDFAD